MPSALGRFHDSVHAVSVRLGDINGPRGGADKLCRIVVRLKNSPRIIIEELGDDIFQVIDKVADRVHQSVSRQVGRVKRAARGEHRTFGDEGWLLAPV
jgi:ribosome-associated translation inhibitor RaiA